MSISPWIPLFESLVWPVVIALFLLFFRTETRRLYEAVLSAVTEGGRGLEIAGIFKLGEAARSTPIGALAVDDVVIEGLVGTRDDVVKVGCRRPLLPGSCRRRIVPSRSTSW